jgi:hypothetical protein|eukprot:COSAG06_NODE_6499_length_2906_cov_2.575042_3_plen_116_part_00
MKSLSISRSLESSTSAETGLPVLPEFMSLKIAAQHTLLEEREKESEEIHRKFLLLYRNEHDQVRAGMPPPRAAAARTASLPACQPASAAYVSSLLLRCCVWLSARTQCAWSNADG